MNNRISVQTTGPDRVYGIVDTYKKVKEWGFDAVDANLNYLLPYGDIVNSRIPEALVNGGKEFIELIKPWKEGAEKYGIENYQAHAPYPCWVSGLDDANRRLLEVQKNMIRACEVISCRNLVIHPFFASYDKQLTPEDERELNLESYSQLIPLAKECGVTICLENMFTGWNGRIYAAICNEPKQAAEYVDTLNAIAGQEVFGFCMDTGHSLLVGQDIKNFMSVMGQRIKAFHIHDNNGMQDQHLAPFMGALDWNRFMEGLDAIDYKGVLSFETHGVWDKVDHRVIDEMMKYLAACGRMFADKLE